MNRNEVIDLLAIMAVYDKRNVGEVDVQAWLMLPVIKRNDFQTCSEAVIWFYDRNPDERGNVPYLTPQWMRLGVIAVKERRVTEANRARARMTPAERSALEAVESERMAELT